MKESADLYPSIHGPIHRALAHHFPYGLFYLIDPDADVVDIGFS